MPHGDHETLQGREKTYFVFGKGECSSSRELPPAVRMDSWSLDSGSDFARVNNSNYSRRTKDRPIWRPARVKETLKHFLTSWSRARTRKSWEVLTSELDVWRSADSSLWQLWSEWLECAVVLALFLRITCAAAATCLREVAKTTSWFPWPTRLRAGRQQWAEQVKIGSTTAHSTHIHLTTPNDGGGGGGPPMESGGWRHSWRNLSMQGLIRGAVTPTAELSFPWGIIDNQLGVLSSSDWESGDWRFDYQV